MNKAQALYDSIGNEIFKDLVAQLRLDNSAKEFKRGEAVGFDFDDGSSILFEGGFANVTSSAATPAQVPTALTISEQLENTDGVSKELAIASVVGMALIVFNAMELLSNYFDSNFLAIILTFTEVVLVSTAVLMALVLLPQKNVTLTGRLLNLSAFYSLLVGLGFLVHFGASFFLSDSSRSLFEKIADGGDYALGCICAFAMAFFLSFVIAKRIDIDYKSKSDVPNTLDL